MKKIIISFIFLTAVCLFALTPAYKICPKCGKVYQLEYNYCPDDGTLLVQIGETVTPKDTTDSPKPSLTPKTIDNRIPPESTKIGTNFIAITPKPESSPTPIIIKTDSGEIKRLYPSDFGGDMIGCPDDMVYVSASSFNMGTKTFPFPKDAKLIHSVFLDGYCIDKFEYPNKLFNKPLANINYFEASQKCNEIGKRLCTEAEWEKACKGQEFFEYPYGKRYEIHACHIEKDRMEGPIISGEMAKCVSSYGVFDMSGNVAEWVYDYYDEKYYYNSPQSNPKGPGNGTTRVVKGGSWVDFGMRTKCAYRDSKSPDYSTKRVGFRCCKDPG